MTRSRSKASAALSGALFAAFPFLGLAQSGDAPAQPGTSYLSMPVVELEKLTVQGKAYDLIDIVYSSSAGVASNAELSQRPFQRRGELLEAVPGMIVTQHAGGGKANQYFVRGYNLDHGTDFHVGLDGMPINFLTHAHGQGYVDVNFIIPEFVERLDYFKGPYFAEYGDLSTAGGAMYRHFHVIPEGLASLTIGERGYQRAVFGDAFQAGDGSVSLGAEYSHEDGPWRPANDYGRKNVFARYHRGDDGSYLDFTFLAHQGEWNSSDQIPHRASESGAVGRFGAIDETTGGKTSRYSLQANWQKLEADSVTRLDAWIGRYALELYSNFSYFLNDPVNGDQFEQNERRAFGGFSLWQERRHELAGRESHTRYGLQTRNDRIGDLGLYATRERQRLGAVREDDVYVGSYSIFAENETALAERVSVTTGLRADLFHFDIDSDLPANSGDKTEGIASPKLNITLGPWSDTEVYINSGLGFHSNDARGVSIAVDPTDGVTPAAPVDPLVRTWGAEIGVRTRRIQDLSLTATLWHLRSESELVFVGDGGATEPSDGSRRWGVELAGYWRPNSWLSVDGEYAYVDARFDDGAPSGLREIPNSIDHSVAAGVVVGQGEGFFGALRGRYFAPRPLEESGTIESKESIMANVRFGYRREGWEVALDVLNLLDRDDNDIEYFYESRLPGEPLDGVEDIHFHPVEPRQVRLTVTRRY